MRARGYTSLENPSTVNRTKVSKYPKIASLIFMTQHSRKQSLRCMGLFWASPFKCHFLNVCRHYLASYICPKFRQLKILG